MGAAVSTKVGPRPAGADGAADGKPQNEEATGSSGSGNASRAIKARLSMMGNIAIPQVKRAGTGERNFLGVALQFDNKKEAAPPGCVQCTCEKQFDIAAIEKSDEYFVVEYIQEELKKVTMYVTNPKQSRMTARGAKFMGPWFHADLEMEIPKTIRHIDPPHAGAKWVESWHVTRYLGYHDPYTRQKSRFRVWRRVGRHGEEHMAAKAAEAAAREAALENPEANGDADDGEDDARIEEI